MDVEVLKTIESIVGNLCLAAVVIAFLKYRSGGK